MNPRYAATSDCPLSRSLLDMPCGCMLRVEELTGSPSARSRLYSMGILPGTEMELCRQSCNKGSVCVRVRGTSLVLCENMAKSILCRAADENEAHRHRRHSHGRWGLHNPFGACAAKKTGKACCRDS